ncbi:hypothetical protein ACIQI8_31095 [Streptomyces sp. NPDC092369]|uniref:hypothetical protein n=1 Tax=Streptomyces sp. NPDC092369 TaxID=3366015 RepID=UPI00382847BD
MTITGGRLSKAWQRAAAQALGTPWITTVSGVREAIPPVYAHWIATQYFALEARSAA